MSEQPERLPLSEQSDSDQRPLKLTTTKPGYIGTAAGGPSPPQQCGLCGAFLSRPKPGDHWRVCSRCGTEHEVLGTR
jgi:hypothetical protein